MVPQIIQQRSVQAFKAVGVRVCGRAEGILFGLGLRLQGRFLRTFRVKPKDLSVMQHQPYHAHCRGLSEGG